MTDDNSHVDDYSPTAEEQLDALEVGPDVDLYNAIIQACELIFLAPEIAQNLSTAFITMDGIVFRLPVAGYPPYKVFWSTAGPRIEAVFPHE